MHSQTDRRTEEKGAALLLLVFFFSLIGGLLQISNFNQLRQITKIQNIRIEIERDKLALSEQFVSSAITKNTGASFALKQEQVILENEKNTNYFKSFSHYPNIRIKVLPEWSWLFENSRNCISPCTLKSVSESFRIQHDLDLEELEITASETELTNLEPFIVVFGNTQLESLNLEALEVDSFTIISLGRITIKEIKWNYQRFQRLTLYSALSEVELGLSGTPKHCEEQSKQLLSIRATMGISLNEEKFFESCWWEPASNPMWKDKKLLGFKLS